MDTINTPCVDCGKTTHSVDERGYCYSLPVKGHEKPDFARVTTIRGQEVLVRVTRETHPKVADIVSPWRIEIGGQPARNVIDPADFGLTYAQFNALTAVVP